MLPLSAVARKKKQTLVSLPSEWTLNFANSSFRRETTGHRYQIICELFACVMRCVCLRNVLKFNTKISIKSSMSNRWRKRQTKPREAATEPPKNKHKRKREIHVKSIRNLLFRRLNLLHCHCLLTRVCVCSCSSSLCLF